MIAIRIIVQREDRTEHRHVDSWQWILQGPTASRDTLDGRNCNHSSSVLPLPLCRVPASRWPVMPNADPPVGLAAATQPRSSKRQRNTDTSRARHTGHEPAQASPLLTASKSGSCTNLHSTNPLRLTPHPSCSSCSGRSSILLKPRPSAEAGSSGLHARRLPTGPVCCSPAPVITAHKGSLCSASPYSYRPSHTRCVSMPRQPGTDGARKSRDTPSCRKPTVTVRVRRA